MRKKRRESNTIKRLIVFSLMTGLLLLSACSKDNINYFPSKEAALEEFIRSGEINGNIDMVTTMNDEELLVTQQDKNNYFVGELLEDKKGFAANRVSDNAVMELGGSWELKTNANHKYTIYFEKEQENQNYFPLSNGDYYISIAEGHQIQKENPTFTNSIKDIKAIKD
ncbi:hypothetical protein [Bacillus sp. PK3_68]|uniref:hypothetical protein n=1 Tax=Bacillus sp. PK3_68 TaxID=2027408 RepID=UPI000E711291|nr:hypothetical protein [Bacillus sp. PK3_68]RJS50193.1 hypothetical protein CJ483_23375 [Bacillus sp. PK3_68]